MKLYIYKAIEKGFWPKLVLFCVLNVIILGTCIVVHNLIETDPDVLRDVRLFLNSNSLWPDPSIEKEDIGVGKASLLLFIECLGTILFSGLIISIITTILHQKTNAAKEGHVHYKLSNHVVIIGFDNVVPSIISEIINDPSYGKCNIVVQTNQSVDEARHHLFTKLSKRDMKRVVLIHAPRQSAEELELLYTSYARQIFIVGNHMQSDHDAENMHTFEELVRIHKKHQQTQPIPLMVWFENEASYAALQLNDVCKEWKEHFVFMPYNFYKRWANRLLTGSVYGRRERKIIYPELDHDGITADSNKHVHLIIVGMNRMGIALAKEAAHILHFPNFDERTGANRTRITFIDNNADQERNFFCGHYPGYFQIAPVKYADLMDTSLSNPSEHDIFGKEHDIFGKSEKDNHFLDVQFEFIKGRIESKAVRDWLRKEMQDKTAITTIAICVHNPSESFGMAMYLPEEVYTRGRNDKSRPWEVTDKDQIVNIFVRQEKTGALIKAFGDAADASAKNKRYANLYPFGMVDDSFELDYYSNHLAMAFNYIYEEYFKNDKTLPATIPQTDILTRRWKAIPVASQWSNLYLADSIEFKLRSINLNHETVKDATLAKKDIDDLARTEHSRWNMEKLMLGYRPLTKEERLLDEETRKELKNKFFAHQLIVPYSALSDDDKTLDYNIIIKLPSIIKEITPTTKHGKDDIHTAAN